MNNFINTINVEGVDYDIQTSINPPLAYSENNSLYLQVGTGLAINDGSLIADIAHKFYHFNSIIIDPKYWLVDNQGYLLPSSTLQIGTVESSLKTINTLLIGSGLYLLDNLLRLGGIPISTDGGSKTLYIDLLIIGTGLQVSDNVIDITVPVSTDSGSSVSYLKFLNIGQGLKYSDGELSIESNQAGGSGIHISTGEPVENAPIFTGIQLSDDFSFDTGNSLLSLNLSFGPEFNLDGSKKLTLKCDNETISVNSGNLTLSSNIKGLGFSSDGKYGVKTINPLYINDDNLISIHIGSALNIESGSGKLHVFYDSACFTQNENGELTLSDIVKEKLGL